MTNGFEINQSTELKPLQLLDTLPEREFDDLTNLAAFICDTPVSLISLITDTRQFFKSHHGIDISETPIDQSFCIHTLSSPDTTFIVEDARKDERFKDNLLVTEKPNIVFYAGVPLISNKGNAWGAFCVMDVKPRKLTQKQLEALRTLSNQVVQLFEQRKNRIELKNIGENLSMETHRLNSIIDATRVGTWEWNIQTGEITVSERWAEMLGYTLSELDPLSFDKVFSLIVPADAQIINEKIDACLNKESDYYEGDFRFLHKNGHPVWIHDRGQVISWSTDGQPVQMAGTHTDFTERKNTEIQFKNITNNIPGAVFRYKINADGTDELQMVSDGARTLWGFSAQEVMQNNKLIWERYENEDYEGLLASIKKSFDDLSFWEYEWRYDHPDGTVRWHKGSGSPVRLDDGSTIWDSVILDITSVKETELGIEQSEKRFRSLVQNGSDLIAILDVEANYQYVSPTSTSILGIPPEEFVGKNAFDYMHPDDKESVRAYFSRLEQEKQVSIPHFRFKQKDGSWRWIETLVTNLIDDPAIRGVVANSRDITDRIHTQKKLKKSEAYYRGLSESQTNYLIRTDLDGNYTYVNKKFAEEFGWMYPNEKILGKNSMKSIVEYHHHRVREIVFQCMAAPEMVFQVEIDKPAKNGEVISTLWDFICVLDTEGTPSEIQCVGLDITDRMQAEKALKESEQRYSDLFHLSPQPMWVYEVSTLKFLDVNQAAISHYGYSYEEFLNMTLRDIRPESEIPKLEAALAVIKDKDEHYTHGEYLHKKRNGEEIIVDIQSNIVLYKGRKAEVVLATDITDRYNYIQAIKAQNEKLKKIAWTQSHLVRAPLARIMGLAELLKDPDSPIPEKQTLLDHLVNSASELDEIIKKIVFTAQKDTTG